MPRQSTGPRYYPSKQGWFANLHGQRVRLTTGAKTRASEKLAKEKYRRLAGVLEASSDGDRSTVRSVLEAYLTDARTRVMPAPLAPNTYQIRQSVLKNFCDFKIRGRAIGDMQVRRLTPADAKAWVAERRASKAWNSGGSAMRWQILLTAFRWAAGEGELLGSNPLERRGKKTRMPAADLSIKRLAVTEAEHAALYTCARRRKKGNFAELLAVLFHTGARPAEVYKARAEEWRRDLQALVIDPSDPRSVGRLKNRRSLLRRGRKRTIRIPDHLVPILDRLAAEAATRGGFLFSRERSGQPWPDDCDVINHRFKKLVRRANRKAQTVRSGLSLYSYRHGYVTRFLKAGGDPMVLCELLNTSLPMLHRHYSHLFEEHETLLGAVNRLAAQTAGTGPQNGGSPGAAAGEQLAS